MGNLREVTYPEVFRMIDDGGSTSGYYAKGDYSVDDMIDGIEQEEGPDYFEFEDKKKLKAYKTYFRCVPVSKYDDLPFAYWLIDSKPGRGAFYVTVLYL